jgi:parallel beta-helix repeat protein
MFHFSWQRWLNGHLSSSRDGARRSKQRRAPLGVEFLEQRLALSTFAVNSTGDDPLGPNPNNDDTGQVHDDNGIPTGVITLRSAIQQINVDGGGTITFTFAGTISPSSQLPDIGGSGVTVDGTTAPGYPQMNGGIPGPVVDFDGSGAGVGADGLFLRGDGITVKGLCIHSFGSDAIFIASSGNTIEANYLGTDLSGTSSPGGQADGIQTKDTSDNTIRGNLISGNSSIGILFAGEANNNLIEGNFIGADVSGTLPLGNDLAGGYVALGSGNTIQGNTISGNNGNTTAGPGNGMGIYIGRGSKNQIVANYIGTDNTGNNPLGNQVGIVLDFQVSDTTIGGTTTEDGNVIAANLADGIEITGGATNNQVINNFIGTNILSEPNLGNGMNGVLISQGATKNIIGGQNQSNTICSNKRSGIEISGSTTTDNLVIRNFIGTDKDRHLLLGNVLAGVTLDSSAHDNLVGGLDTSFGNLIAYNNQGVNLDRAAHNSVRGNEIWA